MKKSRKEILPKNFERTEMTLYENRDVDMDRDFTCAEVQGYFCGSPYFQVYAG